MPCHRRSFNFKEREGGPPSSPRGRGDGPRRGRPIHPIPHFGPPGALHTHPPYPPIPILQCSWKNTPFQKVRTTAFLFFLLHLFAFFLHFRASPNFAISTLQFPHCNFHIAFSTFVFLHSFAFPALSARKIQPKNRSKKMKKNTKNAKNELFLRGALRAPPPLFFLPLRNSSFLKNSLGIS